MEIINQKIIVTDEEIATTRDRMIVDRVASEALRSAGVLIDLGDMRSPTTIAEALGLLEVKSGV